MARKKDMQAVQTGVGDDSNVEHKILLLRAQNCSDFRERTPQCQAIVEANNSKHNGTTTLKKSMQQAAVTRKEIPNTNFIKLYGFR